MTSRWLHFAVALAMVQARLPGLSMMASHRLLTMFMVGQVRMRQGRAIGLYLRGLERIASDPSHPGRERAAEVLSLHRMRAAGASVGIFEPSSRHGDQSA